MTTEPQQVLTKSQDRQDWHADAGPDTLCIDLCPACLGPGCDACRGAGFVDHTEDLTGGDGPARFCIDDADKANWLLRKLAGIDAEQARVQAQAAEIVRRLEADRTRLLARHEADLRAWTAAEQARQGKGKTLVLLQGTLTFRTVPASLKVVSPTEALNYGRERGWDVVKTVESLDAAAYRRQAAAALAESGELLPGVENLPETQAFRISFKADSGKGEGEGGE